MAPKPSFESMFSNPFFGNNSLKDFNQNPDVNFYNAISSLLELTTVMLRLNAPSNRRPLF